MNQQILVVVMGVSGCGKSSVAEALAKQFNFEFVEADDFHSEENKRRMSGGLGLTDAMRAPWIASIQSHLKQAFKAKHDCVLSFSGLRRSHRAIMRDLPYRTIFIHLKGEQALIAERIKARKHHFMPASLLDSQYAALEISDRNEVIFEIDINQSLNCTIAEACEVLQNSI